MSVSTCHPLFGVPEGALIAGKYRIRRVLGRGSMGIVVEAEHKQLRQRVAIKFLLPQDGVSPEASARFLREARAAADIESEHVVRATDVDALEDGTPYMVMEFLEGGDLAAILENSIKLPIPTAVDYVVQACEGLAEAHERGIVHRDIKPSNLFLAKGRRGRLVVKVVDFGISKLKEAGEADSAITKAASFIGSPRYMSPEQLASSHDVDTRTDIWAMGVTLYELLTGKAPFSGPTIAKLCYQVTFEPPSPLCDLRADVPAGLEAVVARCLAKQPNERFQSMLELASALTPFKDVAADDLLPSSSVSKPSVLDIPPSSNSPWVDNGGGSPRTVVLSGPEAALSSTPIAGPNRRRRRGVLLTVFVGAIGLVGYNALHQSSRTAPSRAAESSSSAPSSGPALVAAPTPELWSPDLHGTADAAPGRLGAQAQGSTTKPGSAAGPSASRGRGSAKRPPPRDPFEDPN